jgi:hypothetical protein
VLSVAFVVTPITIIAVSLAVVLFMLSWLAFGLSSTVSGGAVIPERRFGYRPETLQRFIDGILPADERGSRLHYYRRSLGWDVLFAVSYGVGLSFVLWNTWGVQFEQWHVWRPLAIAPAVLGALADVVEDVLLLSALPDGKSNEAKHLEVKGRLVVACAGGCTCAKLVLVPLAVAAMVGGVVGLTCVSPPVVPLAAAITLVVWVAWMVLSAVAVGRQDRSHRALPEIAPEPCGPDPDPDALVAESEVVEVEIVEVDRPGKGRIRRTFIWVFRREVRG